MALQQPLREIGLLQKTQGEFDPRWVRSRQALTEAVLQLAAEQPISSVSVDALTKRAGVNRATFYNHAKTPQALLQSVLRAELDERFDAFHLRLLDSNGHLPKVQEFGIRSLINHVQERECVYRKSLERDPSDLVHLVLTEFLIDKARILMTEQQYRFSPAAPDTDFQREFAVHVGAAGLVGGIITWLQNPEHPSVEDFMTAYYMSLPEWFTMTGPAYD
jgi:AcrR family transcriptional regulator